MPDRPSSSDPGPDPAAGASAEAEADSPTPLSEIGAALRRLRMQRGLRQYEAADAAGVTKAMLSAYETGKRRPSLKTLDSLLEAMNAHLGDLHRALMAERHQNSYLAGDRSTARPYTGRPHVVSEAGAPAYAESGYGGLSLGAAADVYDLLGIHDPLPPEEERALSEMLRGFLKLLRFMHHNTTAARASDGGEGGSGSPFDEG